MSKPAPDPCGELSARSEPFAVRGAPPASLALFEHQRLPPGSGVVAFLGGPIWALEWHPAGGVLVASANPRTPRAHAILSSYTGSAHLQLWAASSDGSARCVALIPHTGHCAWDLKWSPAPPEGCFGWLAAALGDGRVCMYEVMPLPCDNANAEPVVLEPECMLLREGCAVARTLSWSTDGSRLAVGAVDGTLDVFGVGALEGTWPVLRLQPHTCPVMGVHWFSEYVLATLNSTGSVIVCDVRDAATVLEHSSEALAWSYSMGAIEPDVIAVGCDNGLLRVIKVGVLAQFNAKQPVKKLNVQAGAFRHIASVPAYPTVSGTQRTLMFTGGAEGVVHQCNLPRPIWLDPQRCILGKTRFGAHLSWATVSEKEAESESSGADGVTNYKHLELVIGAYPGDTAEKEEELLVQESRIVGRSLTNAVNNKPASLKTSRQNKARIGKLYTQAKMITRIAVSPSDGLLAVGIDAGLLTITPIVSKGLSLRKSEAFEGKTKTTAAVAAKTKRPAKATKKRRKSKMVDDRSDMENADDDDDDDDDSDEDFVEPKRPKKRAKTSRKPLSSQSGDEAEDSVKAKSGRRRKYPLKPFGPKRKRGRPRKYPLETDEEAPLVADEVTPVADDEITPVVGDEVTPRVADEMATVSVVAKSSSLSTGTTDNTPPAESGANAAQKAVSGDDGGQPKRKLGRPRKLKPKVMGPKRPRGRPRKVPVAADDATHAHAKSASKVKDTENDVRPRGRPRKAPVDTDEATHAPAKSATEAKETGDAKRPRGRPRKVPFVTGESTHAPAKLATKAKDTGGAKRPRGRPRKVPVVIDEATQLSTTSAAKTKSTEDAGEETHGLDGDSAPPENCGGTVKEAPSTGEEPKKRPPKAGTAKRSRGRPRKDANLGADAAVDDTIRRTEIDAMAEAGGGLEATVKGGMKAHVTGGAAGSSKDGTEKEDAIESKGIVEDEGSAGLAPRRSRRSSMQKQQRLSG